PVSTIRWVPVKNGWQSEQTSVLSSGRVEPVRNVLPQTQVTVASVWNWGCRAAFMDRLVLRGTERTKDTTGAMERNGAWGGASLRPRSAGMGDRSGEVAVGHLGEPSPNGLQGRPHPDSRLHLRQLLDEPVVIDVEAPPLDLVDPHLGAGGDGRLQLPRGVGDAGEGEQIETDLASRPLHDPAALEHLVEPVPDGAVVGPEDRIGEGDGADPDAVAAGRDHPLQHPGAATVGVDMDGRGGMALADGGGGLPPGSTPGQRL